MRTGHLSATVVAPASSRKAIALMTRALQTKTQPGEHTLTAPEPFPPPESLKPVSSWLP